MPAFEESDSSPCKSCPYMEEDKRKFPECINCNRRLGGQTRFLPEGAESKEPKKEKAEKPCSWPWGCTEKTVRAEYCFDHRNILEGRKRALQGLIKKGEKFTEEQKNQFLFRPVLKGRNKDAIEIEKKNGVI